jgi:hypothetical protein
MLLDDLSPIFQDSAAVTFLMIERPMNNEHYENGTDRVFMKSRLIKFRRRGITQKKGQCT